MLSLSLGCLVLPTVVLGWPTSISLEASQSGDVPPNLQPSSHSDAGDLVSYYVDSVEPGVQSHCAMCHKPGGVASLSGARLVLGDSAEQNHEAFAHFLSDPQTNAAWVLSKVTGGADHGGGAVLAEGSTLYISLEWYLSQLEGGRQEGDGNPDFWRGTAAERRETTLQRATLLFSGELPGRAALSAVNAGDEALRAEILSTMQGEGFRQFLITGANDRLLISGLNNGINFDISTYHRFPMLADLMSSLPRERPEELEGLHDRPYFTRADADWMFRRAITMEPLQLIAHVVMSELPYTEVLTADYTMVNALSDLVYRSGSGFDHEFAASDGFYDRRSFRVFRPGVNDGHIAHDDAFEVNEEEGIYRFGEYQAWPHAGLLSTQAWLARYPSTDTNRNRARARWTYLHFLGVDIENSAPRSTDPDALADKDNPTMHNPACTVCHERLDPVAGAYQSYGDLGHYLDQYGGMDSLSEAYKCPECFGGEWGSTGYQDGDTWYRDMRSAGFEGESADQREGDSLQWLGRRIAADSRFAKATVIFWWPTVFGEDPLDVPQAAAGTEGAQRLRAFTAQQSLIDALASSFISSGFDLKSLFADMVMSPWYRHSEVTDAAMVSSRSLELSTVGRGRLLTPEELDRKNRAVFGRTWRQWGDGTNPHAIGRETALTGQWAPYKAFYGGIDGATVTARNRYLTPLMANVAEAMAIDLSCQVVLEDFSRPQSDRRVFTLIEKDSLPGHIAAETSQLSGKVADMESTIAHRVELHATLVNSPTKIRIQDLTKNSHQSVDGQWSGAEIILKSVIFRQRGSVVHEVLGRHLAETEGFRADQWQDDEGRTHWRGHSETGGWRFHPGSWAELEVQLPAGSYEVEVWFGTALLENNVNEAMSVKTSLRATRNLGQTRGGEVMRQQIGDLLKAATNRDPSPAEVTSLLWVLEYSSQQARKTTPWFLDRGNHCETWWVWPEEELEEEGYWQRYGDSEGMMRGWATVLHSIMVSYGYLHD